MKKTEKKENRDELQSLTSNLDSFEPIKDRLQSDLAENMTSNNEPTNINNTTSQKKVKDYNTKMAINVPDDEIVKMVNMGDCKIINGKTNEHLLTYGLGPCVGVAIVIKSKSGEITRLLAHIDMGQILGMKIESLAGYLRNMKNNISGIKDIEISLTSTQSYRDLKNLNRNEENLIKVISNEFREYGITQENINYNYSSQVQISPKGKISTYTEYELESHKEKILQESLHEFNGYIEPKLNIYITKHGAWMSNCSGINPDSSEQEKDQYLNKYYGEYIKNGYKIKFGPSFNNPDLTAIYLENRRDPKIQKPRGIPGCIVARNQLLY